MKRCGELGGTNAKNSSVEGELHGGGGGGGTGRNKCKKYHLCPWKGNYNNFGELGRTKQNISLSSLEEVFE